MTESTELTGAEDSKVDAISALLLITIVVVAAVFWVSGQ